MLAILGSRGGVPTGEPSDEFETAAELTIHLHPRVGGYDSLPTVDRSRDPRVPMQEWLRHNDAWAFSCVRGTRCTGHHAVRIIYGAALSFICQACQCRRRAPRISCSRDTSPDGLRRLGTLRRHILPPLQCDQGLAHLHIELLRDSEPG